MKTLQLALVTLSLSVVVFLECSPVEPDEHAGNSTQTGNPGMVAGILYQPDATTRAARVPVYIRPRSTLADTRGLGLTKRLAVTDSVMTDDTGYFAIDTIDTGMYVIEANSGDTALALIDSVHVVSDTELVEVTDTLLPPGNITGTIYLSEGGDPRRVFILAFGINRFTMPDAAGRFAFDSLAEAAYDLRIVSSQDDYAVLDTFGVPVVSQQVTDLDTLVLPYTGIPTVMGLSLSYDTLKQIVMLSWTKADSNLVKGYNVYRTHSDSTGKPVQLNSALLTDTTFSDSTGVQDQTYTYQVKAVDKDGNAGLLSTGVGVEVVSAFVLVDSLGSNITELAGFAVVGGNVVTADKGRNRVERYSSLGVLSGGWGVAGSDSGGFGRIEDLAVDDSGFVYVVDAEHHRVQKFDSSGTFVLSWGGQGSDSGLFNTPYRIAVFDTVAYVAQWHEPKVQKFTVNGEYIATIGQAGTGSGEFRSSVKGIDTDSAGYLYAFDGFSIQRFDNTGLYTGTLWSLTKEEQASYQGNNLCISNATVHITTMFGQVFAYDLTGALIYTLDVSNLLTNPNSARLEGEFLYVGTFGSGVYRYW